MPRWTIYIAIVIATAALIPPVIIAKSRTVRSTKPRIHLFFDMDDQPKYKAQQASSLFEDGRAMRMPPAHTIARGDLQLDDHYFRGRVGDEWATTIPADLPVTMEFLHRGQARFDIYCAPCHGLDGAGRGTVAVRAEELQQPTWVPPLSFHSQQVLERPVGHIFNTITHGIRTMPPYGPQIPVEDRWAIVAYVRALQKSQHAGVDEVPAAQRDSMR